MRITAKTKSNHSLAAVTDVLWCLMFACLILQLYFLVRLLLWRDIDPASTAFERSQIGQIVAREHDLSWSQEWVDGDKISDNLRQAVIASEDGNFTKHGGVEWDILQKMQLKNAKAQAIADERNEAILAKEEKNAFKNQKNNPNKNSSKNQIINNNIQAKIQGGSTISQQLAKNLFLSGERNYLRKGQELIITLAMEKLWSKQRILDVYLNHVEWGVGVFGAQAAAQHYFRKNTNRLQKHEAARMAVMLPSPKSAEKNPYTPRLNRRMNIISNRMDDVYIP